MVMTNEERDKFIMQTHDGMTELIPLIRDIKKIVFGNGDVKTGLNYRTLLLEERQVAHENFCPARKAVSSETKRNHIANVAIVISALSLVSMIVFSIISLL